MTTGAQQLAQEVESLARPITLRPAFIGAAGRELFALYEGPDGDTRGGHGVVLCYPHARDHAAAYRAFRVLASRLAAGGLRTLRFDYSGTGDSSGDVTDGSVDRWLDDIVTAAGSLRSSYGCATMSLVGLRLGATLAALASRRCGSVDRLVLWDPVIEGRAYVRELTQRHRQWIDEEARERRMAARLARPDEALGYGFGERMQQDLERLRLDALAEAPAPDVHIVTHVESDDTALARHLEGLGVHVTRVRVGGPKVWGTMPGMEQGLVPAEAIREIVSRLGRGPQ